MLGAMFFKSTNWEMSSLYSQSNQSTFYYSFDFHNEDSLYSLYFGDPRFDLGKIVLDFI